MAGTHGPGPFAAFLSGVDPAVASAAVQQARDQGLTFAEFRQALGAPGAALAEATLRRGYAAALLDAGVSGLTPRQAEALFEAVLADAEFRWSSPQDGCHAGVN